MENYLCDEARRALLIQNLRRDIAEAAGHPELLRILKRELDTLLLEDAEWLRGQNVTQDNTSITRSNDDVPA